jgi:hypothetical protein
MHFGGNLDLGGIRAVRESLGSVEAVSSRKTTERCLEWKLLPMNHAGAGNA